MLFQVFALKSFVKSKVVQVMDSNMVFQVFMYTLHKT